MTNSRGARSLPNGGGHAGDRIDAPPGLVQRSRSSHTSNRGNDVIDRAEWSGRIGQRTDPVSPLVVELPLTPSPAGGSGTFLAEASDQRRWWVKPQNNLQGERVIVTEYIVASAGHLISAPVCQVAIVEIPEEITDWEFRPGAGLQPGLAHASLAVNDAFETRALEYRDCDDNRRRHAGVHALYDWCWGGDDQWLYSETDDRKLYSHDHGWYLPENGPNWDEATLLRRVDEPHPARHPTADLDAGELRMLATRLRRPLRDPLIDLLTSVPASWPVADADLEALGFFLERRAAPVAARLESMTERAQ